MRAMVLHGYGEPGVLRPEDLPIPQPGPGEVRVRVRAVSVNPIDTKWRRAGPYTTFPVVLGWDVSGEVDALGPGVGDFAVGDGVHGMVRFPEEGRAYAEHVVAPAAHLARKPPELDHVHAAAMTLAALTAEQALSRMHVGPGQRVLIHAGAGGVGHFAVQLAKARGAVVLATASAANGDFVRSLGADEVVDYRERPFEAQVGDMDAVLDAVGGDTQTRSFGVVRPGGHLVSIVGPPPPQDLAQQHGIRAERLLVQPSRPDLERLGALVAAGQLRPHVSRTHALEDVAQAHRALETGRTVGKLVLLP